MDDETMTRRFDEHRPQLVAIAHRMLGSRTEADDAVQEAWLRMRGTDLAAVDNLAAWLTTVVSRVCLNALRSRATRSATPLDDEVSGVAARGDVTPVVLLDAAPDPADAAAVADAVGQALLVVLDTLSPPERIAFVLHDMFAVPFDEIAPIVERSPAATRQLASRARRRVRGREPSPDHDRRHDATEREVVDAFFAAARAGDLARLVQVLDPDVELRVDPVAGAAEAPLVRGATAVAARAAMFAGPERAVLPAIVDGATGVLVAVGRRVVSVMAFTVRDGRIAEVVSLTDPARLAGLEIVRAEGER